MLSQQSLSVYLYTSRFNLQSFEFTLSYTRKQKRFLNQHILLHTLLCLTSSFIHNLNAYIQINLELSASLLQFKLMLLLSKIVITYNCTVFPNFKEETLKFPKQA